MRPYQLIVVGCLLLSPAQLATAQTASPPDSGRGPMIVERVYDGPAIMPEVKLTDLDGHSETLAGASGGWMIDNTFLVGAGGYWLTSQGKGRKLAYGGAVLEWLQGTDGRLGYAVRGLIGGGRATLTETVTLGRGRPGRIVTPPTTAQLNVGRDIFIAEPQADLLVNFSRRFRLDASVGYRLVGAEGDFDRRLRGVTGSIGLQIGGSRSRRQ